MSFVHLHTHTHFSIGDGVPSPQQLSDAAKNNLDAIALTDFMNLYGAVPFQSHCLKNDEKANTGSTHSIIGSEVTISVKGSHHSNHCDLWNLVLLVENDIGYTNLSYLLSNSVLIKDKSHDIDYELLKSHSEGLIALTCGLRGPLGFHRANPQKSKEVLMELLNCFGVDNIFVELQDFGLPYQDELNQYSKCLAKELGIATVVTNDVRYLKRTDAPVLEVLRSINNKEIFDVRVQGVTTDQQYLKSEAEMKEMFPHDLEAIEQTVEIANRCQFQLSSPPPYHLPSIELPYTNCKHSKNTERLLQIFPPSFAVATNYDEPHDIDSYFQWLCVNGLKARLASYVDSDFSDGTIDDYERRLEYEIQVISSMGFIVYMMVVAEFIQWAKSNAIPTGPARGSSAGSLVAWALSITDVDPLKYGLIFERFLNPNRNDMPDIDVDFSKSQRERVIQHLKDKYGADQVSQIISYGMLQAKSALIDTKRILGMPGFADKDIQKYLKLSMIDEETDPQKVEKIENGTKKKVEALHDLVGYGAFEQSLVYSPQQKRLFQTASVIEGKVRQTGIHAGGVIIANKPLHEYSPLNHTEEVTSIQFDKKYSEDIGLVKFDLLGLETLDVIQDTLKNILKNNNLYIDTSSISLDCSQTFQLLQNADTTGIFQLESPGMRGLLNRICPTTIAEIADLLALYRPGPINSGMLKDYVDVRNGGPVKYQQEPLYSILKPTNGALIFQEQILEIAHKMGGLSLADADQFRRAISKKDLEKMQKYKDRFIEGSVEKGISSELANQIFEDIEKFAEYGFNKSHAVSYSLIAYQTAWLKTHYRTEYMASYLSSKIGDKSMPDICAELQHSICTDEKIELQSPSVNGPEWFVSIDKNTIQFGLQAIKSLRSVAIQEILQKQMGGYKSFSDFMDRVDLTKVQKGDIQRLIKAGAFDWTQDTRKAMLKALVEYDSFKKAKACYNPSQLQLFQGNKPTLHPLKLTEMSVEQYCNDEKATLGVHLTKHPLSSFDYYRKSLPRLSDIRKESKDMGSGFIFVGMCSEYTYREQYEKGYCYLDDETGSIKIKVSSFNHSRFGNVLKAKTPLLIHATETVYDGSRYFSLKEARSLLKQQSDEYLELRVRFSCSEVTQDMLNHLDVILKEHPGDQTVILELVTSESNRPAVNLERKVQISQQLRQKVLSELQAYAWIRYK
jgi:DNA polymerase III subunit alpha